MFLVSNKERFMTIVVCLLRPTTGSRLQIYVEDHEEEITVEWIHEFISSSYAGWTIQTVHTVTEGNE